MLRTVLISTICAAPAVAASQCETRDWAAHSHAHRDLGHGRVTWEWDWELEGIATDIHVVECAGHTALKVRARAERMTGDLPYDRRTKARRVIAQAANAPHFFRLDTLSEALSDIRVPSERLALTEEPCACAAYYPGAFDGAQDEESRDP